MDPDPQPWASTLVGPHSGRPADAGLPCLNVRYAAPCCHPSSGLFVDGVKEEYLDDCADRWGRGLRRSVP